MYESPQTDATTELATKVDRLRTIMAAHDAPALQLTRAESLSWLLDGARVSVPYAGPPVCTATVERDGAVTVTASANEADRLMDEELPAGVTLARVPWFEPLPTNATALAEDAVTAELRAARARLLPRERERYARLGMDAARVMSTALRAARPGERETDLAARLAAGIVGAGAEPVVILVAGTARTGIPHPLPTSARLGDRAMAVIGARRHGLVVNLTRWVRFARDDAHDDTDPRATAANPNETDQRDTAPHAADDPHAARLREVEADAFAATRPGRRLDEVLADIAASYARHGFGEEAWRAHHQGGPTGYLGRDPKATPATTDVVTAGQAFAWNPWVPGAKLEDTVIVDDDGIRPLTVDPEWPTIAVRGIDRPMTLTLY